MANRDGRDWTRKLRETMMPAIRGKAREYGLLTIGEAVEVCYLCDEPIDCEIEAGQMGAKEVDHKIPEKLGGPSVLSNLFLTHKRCNNKKLERPFEVVRREIMEGRRSSRRVF